MATMGQKMTEQQQDECLMAVAQAVGVEVSDDPIRVNSCLYGFCKKRTKDCERCERVVAVIKQAQWF